MLNRPLLFVGILAAAFIVPYVLLDKNLSATATAQINQLMGRPASNSGEALDLSFDWPFQGKEAAPLTSVTSLPGVPRIQDLTDIFRFDITPSWVTTRWPRVTTVLAERDLQGLRVPLVTGTNPDDLAGSLTYYFDSQHHLQRITFQGYTGDTRRLGAMCVDLYGLRPAPTLEAGYFLTEHEGQPRSTLRVSHLPIVQAGKPMARAEVLLKLERADAQRALQALAVPGQAPPPAAARPSTRPSALPQTSPVRW